MNCNKIVVLPLQEKQFSKVFIKYEIIFYCPENSKYSLTKNKYKLNVQDNTTYSILFIIYKKSVKYL